MAENKLVGSLILRTIDIDPTRVRPVPANQSFSNDYGICDANGCYVLWKNINIRTCLGELYNKYDKYNLKMTSIQVRHNGSTGATGDAHFVVYIKKQEIDYLSYSKVDCLYGVQWGCYLLSQG